MNLKKIMMFIRGWLPQEPKLPKNLLINSQKTIQSSLRLTNSLKIVYELTLGFAVFYFFANNSSVMQQTSFINLLKNILWQLPGTFFINILPLSIFSIVFLTKGNGLNYFRSWNAGWKLKLSILTIVIGYTSIVLSFHGFFPFTNLIFMFHGFQVIYYLVCFGLSLLTIGFVSLIFLAKKRRKNQTLSYN